MGLLSRLPKQRSPPAQVGAQRHHQALANGVHGRIGHLGKHLTEEPGQPRQWIHQHRQRSVVAHRADGYVALRHRRQEEPTLLGGVPEDPRQRIGIEPLIAQLVERMLDVDGLGVDPLPVGTSLCQGASHLIGQPNLAGNQIEREQLTRPELSGRLGIGFFGRGHSRLGGDDDHVGGEGPAGRTEPVAVHPGQQLDAIRCGDGHRTVPRLGEKGVVLIEGPQRWIEIGNVLPRRRDQHLLGMGQRAATPYQQFDGVVQTARVTLAGLEERHQVGGALLPHHRAQVYLTGGHPRPVGVDRVDLSVVGQHPARLGPPPGGKGVGRVALVEDGEGGLEAGVDQVPVEVVDVAGGEQALVDHRARRGRGHGKAAQSQAAGRLLGVLAPQKETALQVVDVGDVGPRHDHRLLDAGQRVTSSSAQVLRVDGNAAPPRHPQPFGRSHLLDEHAALLRGLRREEGSDHPEPSAGRRSHAPSPHLPGQEPVGNLGEEAGAVAGAVGCDRTSMVEVDEAFHRSTEGAM